MECGLEGDWIAQLKSHGGEGTLCRPAAFWFALGLNRGTAQDLFDFPDDDPIAEKAEPAQDPPAKQDDDSDRGFFWLPLGAVAVAGLASGSGAAAAVAPQPAANSIVTGTVVAGPVIAGHTLKVVIYAANGSTKLCFGSDAALFPAGQQVARVVTARISDDDRRNILGLNALRLFKGVKAR